LSQWLSWTDAIALSTALNANSPVVAAGARAVGSGDAEAMCAQVRTALTNAITGDSTLGAARRQGSAQARRQPVPMDSSVDYPVFHQRYVFFQQTMETDIGALRGRLRVMLAAKTPRMATLASVDAVMERALGSRERALLASVPALLGGHFKRLREAGQDASVDAAASVDATTARGEWLDVFRMDMQSTLLAELEFRLQPVEGLLAALRTS
jgi:hypothetical protein